MYLSPYTIDKAQIEAALMLLEPEPNVANIKIALSSDQCVDKKFDDGYECNICELVLVKPKMCSECEWLNCGECVENWLKKQKTCPRCAVPYEAAKVTRTILNTLNNFEFRCNIDGCSQVFKYEWAKEHI